MPIPPAILFSFLLSLHIITSSCQLQLNTITTGSCPYQYLNPSNSINFTFSVPVWPSNIQTSSFLFNIQRSYDVGSWNVYAFTDSQVYPLNPAVALTYDFGVQLFVANAASIQQGTIITLVINCSSNVESMDYSIVPLITEEMKLVPVSEGVFNAPFQDVNQTMHWFSIPFDNLMYSIITCPTENFGVKVIFESATKITPTCMNNGITYLSGDTNTFLSLTTNFGLKFAFNLTIPPTKIYLGIFKDEFYNQYGSYQVTIIDPDVAGYVYMQAYLNNYQAYSFQLHNDIYVGFKDTVNHLPTSMLSLIDLDDYLQYGAMCSGNLSSKLQGHVHSKKNTYDVLINGANILVIEGVANKYNQKYLGLLYNNTVVISIPSVEAFPSFSSDTFQQIIASLSIYGGICLLILIMRSRTAWSTYKKHHRDV